MALAFAYAILPMVILILGVSVIGIPMALALMVVPTAIFWGAAFFVPWQLLGRTPFASRPGVMVAAAVAFIQTALARQDLDDPITRLTGYDKDGSAWLEGKTIRVRAKGHNRATYIDCSNVCLKVLAAGRVERLLIENDYDFRQDPDGTLVRGVSKREATGALPVPTFGNLTMALSPHSLAARLMAAPMRAGQLVWIGLRPARNAALLSPSQASLIAGLGIDGDHYETRHNGPRQVTLIAREDVTAVAAFLGLKDLAPDLLRRNLVTAGVNLTALKGQHFKIGQALLEGSGECAPCSRMEKALGPGGFNAMRGRGGITARIIEGGQICLGDALTRVA